MSQYLIDQISSTSNIEVLGESEITEVTGKERLSEVVLFSATTKKEETRKAAALFIFIGARPITDWLQIDIIKDNRGFLETGPALVRYDNFHKNWKLKRDPLLLETCIPGVFAAGDMRSGAMNRVASAVGEGSMAIKFVHEYLASN